jgi:hypothetical protein
MSMLDSKHSMLDSKHSTPQDMADDDELDRELDALNLALQDKRQVSFGFFAFLPFFFSHFGFMAGLQFLFLSPFIRSRTSSYQQNNTAAKASSNQ